jgi:hypothetical protein
MAARLMLHPPEGYCIVLQNSCLDLAYLQEPGDSPAGGGKAEQEPTGASAPAGKPRQGAGEKPRKTSTLHRDRYRDLYQAGATGTGIHLDR